LTSTSAPLASTSAASGLPRWRIWTSQRVPGTGAESTHLASNAWKSRRVTSSFFGADHHAAVGRVERGDVEWQLEPRADSFRWPTVK